MYYYSLLSPVSPFWCYLTPFYWLYKVQIRLDYSLCLSLNNHIFTWSLKSLYELCPEYILSWSLPSNHNRYLMLHFSKQQANKPIIFSFSHSRVSQQDDLIVVSRTNFSQLTDAFRHAFHWRLLKKTWMVSDNLFLNFYSAGSILKVMICFCTLYVQISMNW